jgi:predicted ArsR family transcriptional regulator
LIDFVKVFLYFVYMTKKSHHKTAKVKTRRAIINLLKQEGTMDSQELASRLSISAMAVRQHLYALSQEKLVTYQEQPRPMGRPAKIWQLTSTANRLFPDSYAELTIDLLNSMVEAFGEAGLEKLLDIRTRNQTRQYQVQINIKDTLPKKLQTLAEIRTDEGYMAEIQPLDDGSFLLIENHCPICAAAIACTGLCEREQAIFQTVLGQNITIKRTEHLVAGERRCVYQINELP